MGLRKWFGFKGKGNRREEEDNPVSTSNAALKLHKSGRFKEAYLLYVKALKGFETNLKNNPEKTQFQSDVAMTQNNLGTLLWNMGRLEEAREWYEQALDMCEQLLRSDSKKTQFQSYVAGMQNNFGVLLSNRDGWKKHVSGTSKHWICVNGC